MLIDWSINRTPVTVILEPWEYIHAHDVGIKRSAANWGVKDSAAMKDKARQQPNRIANVAATLCEMAVAKYLNQYWSGSVWYRQEHNARRKTPDVGKNVEVRRMRAERGNWLVVRESGNDIPGATVWAAHVNTDDIESRTIEIYGWIPQVIGWEDGMPGASYDEDGVVRLYPINQSYRPEEYFLPEFQEALAAHV
jgi:hypothetical protein